jgi:hypothetical protein
MNLRVVLSLASLAVVSIASCGDSETSPDDKPSETGGTGEAGSGGSSAGLGGSSAGSSAGGVSGEAGAGGESVAGRGGSAGGAGEAGQGGTTGGSGQAGTDPGGTGGDAGSGGAGGAGGANCTFEVSSTRSDVIPTVFSVTWSTDLDAIDEAHIDFGRDPSYGMVAPVNLDEPGHRTLLLGMKPGRQYHFRVSASGPSGDCTSDDFVVQTGAAPALPVPTQTIFVPAAVSGGFLLTEIYSGPYQGYVFILDGDGDPVWWFNPGFTQPSRARMNPDGKFMWIVRTNVPSSAGQIVRVAMNGSAPINLASSFPNIEQDFTILPDETIDYLAWDGSCAKLVEWSGLSHDVLRLNTIWGLDSCNAAALEYSSEDNTLVVSDVTHSALIKVTRTGQVVWVLGGGTMNDFTGDGAVWTTQFNFQMLGKDRILLFNNGAAAESSRAMEIVLDTTAMTAGKVWEYVPSPAIRSQIFGDAQRLPNSNTLVTFSTQGIIHEVDANKNLVRALTFEAGTVLGYVTQRPTLYGPPPE